jgi:hypothetical protein
LRPQKLSSKTAGILLDQLKPAAYASNATRRDQGRLGVDRDCHRVPPPPG